MRTHRDHDAGRTARKNGAHHETRAMPSETRAMPSETSETSETRASGDPDSDPEMDDPVTEEDVWDELTYVEDPELGVDVVNLGLVYDVSVAEGVVTLTMTLTTIGCPAADLIEAMVRQTIGAIPGVEGVTLNWTFEPPWTPGRITEEGRDLLLSMGYL